MFSGLGFTTGLKFRFWGVGYTGFRMWACDTFVLSCVLGTAPLSNSWSLCILLTYSAPTIVRVKNCPKLNLKPSTPTEPTRIPEILQPEPQDLNPKLRAITPTPT